MADVKDTTDGMKLKPITNDKVFIGIVLNGFGIFLPWLMGMFIDYKMKEFLLLGPVIFIVGIPFTVIGFKQVKRNPQLYKNHFLSTIAFIVIILGFIVFISSIILAYQLSHA